MPVRLQGLCYDAPVIRTVAVLLITLGALTAAEPDRPMLLIDCHNDVPLRTVAGFDIGPRAAGGHTDLVRLREGGVGAVFFAAYVAPTFVKERQAARRALEMIDTIRQDIVLRYPDAFLPATSADEVEAARRQGKIAALVGVEGGHAIENSLRVLRTFYRLGARYMTLTHLNTNDWADSANDVARHGGLTDFGRDVVREMNRLGMLVDVSHVSDDTFRDVLEVSSAPVIASHSSCRALCNVPRNLTDEMIAAMAARGGVVAINFACDYLSQQAADAAAAFRLGERRAELTRRYQDNPEGLRAATQALREEYLAKMPRATLADVVAHINRVVKVAGIDHVAIGSDFDGIGCTPAGLDDVSKFPNLTRALEQEGYSAEEIGKIYGRNVLRLLRDVVR